MIFQDKSTVAITKCRKYTDFNSVKDSIKNNLNNIGGLESLVSPGDTVMLKPNFLTKADYKTGVTTNPNVIFATAELCREVGARKVIVAEGAAIGNDTDDIYEELGITELAKKHNCTLINLLKDEFQYFINPLAKNMKRIRLPKIFLESNVVINLPVMKTHDALAVTLGLKNMKGIIHNSDKKRFHKWSLAQNVVDLGHLALPELTIMDGTIGLEGMGPVVGKPVGLGIILSSYDTIALDRVCLEIMGFSLDEVDYIKMAGEQGLGCTDITRINIIGEKIEDIKRPFERLSLDPEEFEKHGIKIISNDACSGCNNAINSYLYGCYLDKTLDKFKNSTLIYGQNPRIPEDTGGKIICLGICTKSHLNNGDLYIPGCPPHPHHINDFIEGNGLKKE